MSIKIETPSFSYIPDTKLLSNDYKRQLLYLLPLSLLNKVNILAHKTRISVKLKGDWRTLISYYHYGRNRTIEFHQAQDMDLPGTTERTHKTSKFMSINDNKIHEIVILYLKNLNLLS